jgi:hypothetical protein
LATRPTGPTFPLAFNARTAHWSFGVSQMHYGFILSCPRTGWPAQGRIRWAKTFHGLPGLGPRLGVFWRIVRYNPIGYKLFRTQTTFRGGQRQGRRRSRFGLHPRFLGANLAGGPGDIFWQNYNFTSRMQPRGKILYIPSEKNLARLTRADLVETACWPECAFLS